MLWCVRLSHKRKAYPIDKNSQQIIIANVVKLESEAKLNVVTCGSTEAKTRIDRPIEPVPHHNENLEEVIKMDVNPSYGLAANISDAKPVSDYDYMLDHSIQHSNVNSTQTQYLSLYNGDPDVAIKIDANPSYGSAMQNVNTIGAGVKNDYDYIDDGLIQCPSHRDVLKKSTARISEDEHVYGPVNQPMSDVAPLDETV